jgi:tetraacyldisaccharide 4'-kinase
MDASTLVIIENGVDGNTIADVNHVDAASCGTISSTPVTTSDHFHDIVSGCRRGPVAAVARGGLWLASLGYGVGVRWRNRRFNRRGSVRAAVPVISVGNLTLGGTGKTPCVEYLARFFRERDIRVTIMSRGYGADHGPNDEALVLEENLPDVPHLQGPDRVALSATAVEELEAELLILDDGFQHRRLHRDLDIVLIDATNPWGHGFLFPRGLLREPKSSLRRAGIVILTKCGHVADEGVNPLRREVQRHIQPGTSIIASDHRPVAWQREGGSECEPRILASRPAAAFCGLGSPESFRRTLADLGIVPHLWRTFPDHHAYTRSDIDELRQWAAQLPSDGVVMTTQKDAVKLRVGELAGRELWALRIGLVMQSKEDAERLEHVLASVEA